MTHPLAVKKGMSRSRDPEQAAAELHRALNDPRLRLVVFYGLSGCDLPALAAATKARLADAKLVGCTTAGGISPRGYLASAIAGFSLSGDDIEAVSQLIALDPFDSEACSTRIQTLLSRLTGEDNNAPSAANAFAFLLIDGLSMQEEMVPGCMHPGLHGIDLIGGSAADHTRFQAPPPRPFRRDGKRGGQPHGLLRDRRRHRAAHRAGRSQCENLPQAFADVHATIGRPQRVPGRGCDCSPRRLESEHERITAQPRRLPCGNVPTPCPPPLAYPREDIDRLCADDNMIGFATDGEQFDATHPNLAFTGMKPEKAA